MGRLVLGRYDGFGGGGRGRKGRGGRSCEAGGDEGDRGWDGCGVTSWMCGAPATDEETRTFILTLPYLHDIHLQTVQLSLLHPLSNHSRIVIDSRAPQVPPRPAFICASYPMLITLSAAPSPLR